MCREREGYVQSILGHGICGYSAHVYYYVQSVPHVYFGMLCLGVICICAIWIAYGMPVEWMYVVCVWCFFSLDVICIFVWYVWGILYIALGLYSVFMCGVCAYWYVGVYMCQIWCAGYIRIVYAYIGVCLVGSIGKMLCACRWFVWYVSIGGSGLWDDICVGFDGV